MDVISISALIDALLAEARTGSSGRAFRPVIGGREHTLQQSAVALLAGQELSEHENPGETTLHVLHGHAVLKTASASRDMPAGTLVIVPGERHSLAAVADTVALLTLVSR